MVVTERWEHAWAGPGWTGLLGREEQLPLKHRAGAAGGLELDRPGAGRTGLSAAVGSRASPGRQRAGDRG